MDWVGEMLDVTITQALPHSLRGEPVAEPKQVITA
jgi:hypothetical protein